MKEDEDGLRLRIFIHESLRHGHQALYEYIVDLARRNGLAGATVFRAIEGYGIHRHIHTTRLVDVSDNLPIIVEIIDSPEMVREFLDLLDDLLPHGTATLSPVHIVKYTSGATR
jgi:PII-like signaling protein